MIPSALPTGGGGEGRSKRHTTDELRELARSVRDGTFHYDDDGKQKRSLDWASYNEAQVNELADTLNLIKRFVDRASDYIPERPRRGEGEAPRPSGGRGQGPPPAGILRGLRQGGRGPGPTVQGEARLLSDEFSGRCKNEPRLESISESFKDLISFRRIPLA